MSRRRSALPILLALVLAGTALVAGTATGAEPTTRTLTLRAVPSSPHSGSDSTLSGTLSASPKSSKVQIQQLVDGRWKTLKTRSTSSSGAYSYSFEVKGVGTRTYRAHAVATKGLAAATSPSRTITVLSKAKGFKKAPLPKVSGTLRVGSTLTASVTGWSPTPSEHTYQWRRDGEAVPGATARTYELAAGDRGAHVTVEVAAVRSGSRTVRESRTDSRVGAGVLTAGSPTLTGEAVVGGMLTAQPGTWTPTPTLAFQWLRNGEPIAGATSAQYSPTAADAGTAVSVRVTATRDGYTSRSASSSTRIVQRAAAPTPPPPTPQTFGDLMHPRKTGTATGVDVRLTDVAPFSSATTVRWDTRGAFTHSLTPVPFGSLTSAMLGEDVRAASTGAEYVTGNSALKNADVEMVVTGRRFAIRYVTYQKSEAQVWIDDHPVSSTPFHATETKKGSYTWLEVDLKTTRTVTVRFAGPAWFHGVEHPPGEPVTVTRAPERFTLGVVSDSYFESPPMGDGSASAPAIVLSSLTGFRVWNLAQSGTGYINDATGKALTGDAGFPGFHASPYGSSRRMAQIAESPIDALLVNGSINDSWWSVAEHRAAVDRFLDKVAAVRPDLPVVLVGLEPVSFWSIPDQSDEKMLELTRNLATAHERHPNVVGFIDPYTENWLTGTGSEAAPTGSGNQDRYVGPDGMHLNGEGHEYYQGRIAEQLTSIPLRQ